jgi:hypothetical protein
MQAFETELVGKRQSLANTIANIENTSCPYTSMLQKRSKPVNQPHTWQAEVYPDADHEPVEDGKDVDTFDTVPRYPLTSYSQKFWRNPAVSDFADEAEIAGAPGGSEMAKQKAIAMIILKRKMESRFLSNSDTYVDGKKYSTRGLFSWISNAAQTNNAVPSAVRTPTAQIYSDTLANFDEADFSAMCQSAFIQRKGPGTYDAFLGIYLKKAFTDFTSYQADKASFTAVRQFTRPGESNKFVNTIDFLKTDCGEYRLHASSFLLTTASTGAASASTHRSGAVVDMDMVGLLYTRLPRLKELENKGGGPRAMCDAIALHQVDTPQAFMKMEIAS